MELNALAQVELELLEIAADVPALGEHRLSGELVVVLNESVIRQERHVHRGLGHLVTFY